MCLLLKGLAYCTSLVAYEFLMSWFPQQSCRCEMMIGLFCLSWQFISGLPVSGLGRSAARMTVYMLFSQSE